MKNSTLNFLINVSAILSIVFNILSIASSLGIYEIGYDPSILCGIGIVFGVLGWLIPTHDQLKSGDLG